MREPEIDDPGYIFRLVIQLVGQVTLNALQGRVRDPQDLMEVLKPVLQKKLKKFRAEKLGVICCYANAVTMQDPYHWPSENIRQTENGQWFDYKIIGMTGRPMLEYIAMTTLVCVAFDILHQEKYKAERAEAIASEEEYDRGMRDYMHGRGNLTDEELRRVNKILSSETTR